MFFSPKIHDVDRKLDFALLLMHSGVIPFSVTSPVTGKSIELGALLSSLDNESASPLKLHYLENDFTDNIRLVYKYEEEKEEGKISKVEQKYILSQEDALNIMRGFQDACFAITEKIDSISSIFVSEEIQKMYSRFVIKPTQYYYDLARRFFHPKYASNLSSFEESVTEQLKISGSHCNKLIKSELESVYVAGSPLLTISWNDTSVYSSFGESGINVYKTCRESLQDTINCFREKNNIDLLSNIMLKALSGKIYCPEAKISDGLRNEDLSNEYIKKHILKEVSVLLESIVSKKSSGVIDLVESGTGGYEVSLIDNGLYAGISGIYYSLLVSYLATGENNHGEVQNMIHDLYLNMNPESVNPAVFTGDMGIIYSLLVEREIFSTDLDTKKISDLIEAATSKIVKTQNCDLFSGSSGVLLLLARLRDTSLFNNNFLEKNAQKIIKHIDSLKIVDENKRFWWPQPFGERENLGGFAHGVAGIAYSLNFWTKNSLAKYLYQGAILAQESLYLGKGQWLDVRQFRNNNRSSSTSWCHGSLGIKKIFPENMYNYSYFSKHFDYTLCHGLSGDIIDGLTSFDNVNLQDKTKTLLDRRLYSAENLISSPDYLINGLFLGRGGVIFALSSFINPAILKHNCLYLEV